VQSSLGLGGETMSVTAMETLDLRGYAQEPYDVVLRAPVTGAWDLAWDFNAGVLRLAPASLPEHAPPPPAPLDPNAPIPADRAQALKVEGLLREAGARPKDRRAAQTRGAGGHTPRLGDGLQRPGGL
jgi:hypothetical protein